MRALRHVGFSLLGLSLLACSFKRGHDATGPKIAHLVLKDDVKSLDPAQSNDAISYEVIENIFEGLVSYSYLGTLGSVIPTVATSLPTYTDKNKTVTFHLRHGVMFQDDPAFPGGKGREVTADDFIYAIKRNCDPRLMSYNWWLFDGIIEGANDWRTALEKAPKDQQSEVFKKPIKGLESPDPSTLVMHFTKPYPQLLQVLSMPVVVAVAHEVVDRYGPEIISHPVGTGPFRLKSWIRGSKVIVEKNPTYRKDFYPTVGSDEDRNMKLLVNAGKPMPFLQEIQWDIIKEEQPRWLKFKSKDLDRIEIPKDNFIEAIDGNSQLKADLTKEGVVLRKAPSLITWWLEFNLKDPTLGKNLKLRQAIAYAFDRARALELLYNNRGMLAASPLPTLLEGGSDVPDYPYAYNVEKAKKLLTEAGYPDGKDLPELTYDLRGPDTTSRQLGDLIKENLGKVGIRLNVLANSFPEALEKAKQSHFQIMLGGWEADYPDPENFLQLFYSGNAAPGTNTSNFADKDYDALYQQIRTELPSASRKKAVIKMAEILQNQVPVVFFYHQMDYYLAWNWLLNYKLHPFFLAPGKYLDLER